MFGNWLGIPTTGAVAKSSYDIVKSGVIELLGMSTRQAMTYYLSHCDEGIVWDTLAVEQNASDIGVNPLLVEFTLSPYTPQQQLDDVLLDVHMTRWGFLRALTHRELIIMLSDPVHRVGQEQNLRVVKLPSHFADTSLLRKERERERGG